MISSHNKRLLRRRTTEYGCNCRTRENCPFQNQCLMPNLVYPADAENNSNKSTKIYFGLAETSFKARIAVTEEQITSRISWSIVEKVYGRIKINFCPLCLAEKLHLIEHFNDNRFLNKRN